MITQEEYEQLTVDTAKDFYLGSHCRLTAFRMLSDIMSDTQATSLLDQWSQLEKEKNVKQKTER